jgi:hypothetical protein
MQKSYFGPNSEYHSKGGKADILCLNMKEKKIVGTELKINPPLFGLESNSTISRIKRPFCS